MEAAEGMSSFCPKFGDHGQYGSADTMVFVCHVTSQTHVIEGSCNFVRGSSSLYVTTLPNLVDISIMIV